jgi:F-type H+-transporting ATPase subunit b
MEALLKSLENFFLGAVPTVILFLLLYAVYRVLVHVPLRKVLSQRQNLTEGTQAKAKADIEAAAAKTSEYEQKLRDARISIFKAQEQRKQQMLQARDAAVAEARERTHKMVNEARASLDKEMAQSRARLQADAEGLAAEVMRSVLKPVAAVPVGGRS